MSEWDDEPAWWQDLRALSLSQPWCWAVVDELVRKWIENRSWQPPISMIGKTIAIHAAKSWDKEPIYRLNGNLVTPYTYVHHVVVEMGDEARLPMRWDAFASAALVGIATIDRIVTKPDTLAADQRRWFFGPFGWVLTNVRRTRLPIPCKGKQGLWTVPAPQREQLLDQLREAA